MPLLCLFLILVPYRYAEFVLQGWNSDPPLRIVQRKVSYSPAVITTDKRTLKAVFRIGSSRAEPNLQFQQASTPYHRHKCLLIRHVHPAWRVKEAAPFAPVLSMEAV
jgi:hypothetical protein